MNRVDFLICYDISDKKRLSKISKYLEKKSLRIQKSIYLCKDYNKNEINEIIINLQKLLNKDEDDVRIYHIDTKSSISLRSAINLKRPTLYVE